MNSLRAEKPSFPEEFGWEEVEAHGREILLDRERNARLPRSQDPFFADVAVYEGPTLADLSENHDCYLALADSEEP